MQSHKFILSCFFPHTVTIADGSKMKCNLTAIVRKEYSRTVDKWIIIFKAIWKSGVNNRCNTWVMEENIAGQWQIIDDDECEYHLIGI